ncbi:MAG: hypothetical protein RR198_06200 [Oscillospiraceae bacterium]
MYNIRKHSAFMPKWQRYRKRLSAYAKKTLSFLCQNGKDIIKDYQLMQRKKSAKR